MTALDNSKFTRRKMLLIAGAGSAGLALAACGNDNGDTGDDPDDGVANGIEVAESAAETAAGPTPGCVLTPEAIEGPFYTDVNLMRRDITEGRPGQALELRLMVADASGCNRLADASVDIWHADAGGLYSAFEDQGDNADLDTTKEKFLRGVQNTDANGVATFDTIYPGWYQGRTTHIHVKVHFADQTRITTQLYFPDDITAEVYGEAAYSERGQKDTTNRNDTFGGDDLNLLMAVNKKGDKYVASGTIGIKKA